MKLTYVIKYVEDMNCAVKFYRDELGFSLYNRVAILESTKLEEIIAEDKTK